MLLPFCSPLVPQQGSPFPFFNAPEAAQPAGDQQLELLICHIAMKHPIGDLVPY